MAPLDLRRLDEQTWSDAMRLCARAFCDYDYVRTLFGDDPVDRITGTTKEYGSTAWDPTLLSIGAWAGEMLVGTAVSARPGDCRVCRIAVPQEEPPAGNGLALAGYRFDQIRRNAHAGFPPHADLTHVAVEPAVQRAGIGRTVINAALRAVREAGGGPILLECIPSLEGFYVAAGFRTVSRFDDPYADGLLLMRCDA